MRRIEKRAHGPERRRPTREELRLWRDAMRGVKRMGARSREEAEEEGPPDVAASSAKASEPAELRGADAKPAVPGPGRPLPSFPELGPGVAPGLDKRRARRLKRGQFEVEARIDLHGYTQREAHAALVSFVRDCYQAGRRCVLVVTGKGGPCGLDAEGASGVLRRAVPRWLNGAPIRPYVLAYDLAQPRDGGPGALYILLRRRR